MIEESQISAEFPYESKFLQVNNSKMHYIDIGTGDPIVFIHGIPTSCYLWRNVIPHLQNKARCIAVDLIGCGESAKPDIQYTIEEHIDYFSNFIDQLNLKNITFVVHGWGSIIGFDYAMKNQNRFKGLAFLESYILPPENWGMLALPVQQIISQITSQENPHETIVNSNYFVDQIFKNACLRKLTDKEMQIYHEPFSTPKSRELIWQYVKELPTGRQETKVTEIVHQYSEQLKKSLLPKLMMYSVPGFTTPMEIVAWAKQNLPNLTLVDLEDGLHFLQESNPHLVGEVISNWYQAL